MIFQRTITRETWFIIYSIPIAFVVTSRFGNAYAQSVSCDNAVQPPLLLVRSSLPLFQTTNPKDTEAIKGYIAELLAELALDDKEKQNTEIDSSCPLRESDRQETQALIKTLLEELKGKYNKWK